MPQHDPSHPQGDPLTIDAASSLSAGAFACLSGCTCGDHTRQHPRPKHSELYAIPRWCWRCCRRCCIACIFLRHLFTTTVDLHAALYCVVCRCGRQADHLHALCLPTYRGLSELLSGPGQVSGRLAGMGCRRRPHIAAFCARLLTPRPRGASVRSRIWRCIASGLAAAARTWIPACLGNFHCYRFAPRTTSTSLCLHAS